MAEITRHDRRPQGWFVAEITLTVMVLCDKWQQQEGRGGTDAQTKLGRFQRAPDAQLDSC